MTEPWEREAKVCADLAGLRDSLRPPARAAAGSIQDILSALAEFMECVRYLNTRRSKNKLTLDSEGDVQDALYLMLRPRIVDLVPENPTDKVGNRYSIKDFLAPSARTVIEAKFVRDASHGKNIPRELHDDIEVYRHHPLCDDLVFFIYDPDSNIPDKRALTRDVVADRTYDGKRLTVHLVVAP